MISEEKMTPAEIYRAGLEVLSRELGVVGMVRFLQMTGACSGDYTAERQQRQQRLMERGEKEFAQHIQKARLKAKAKAARKPAKAG